MNTDDFIKDLKAELLSLIKDKYKKESAAITKDVDEFIALSKDKFKRWNDLLVAQQLTKDEYALLISSQKDLFVMKALHKTGVSAISLGHFKNKVIELIITKAFALLI